MRSLIILAALAGACSSPDSSDLKFEYNDLNKPIVTLPNGQAPPPGLPGDGDLDGYAVCGTPGWPDTHCDCNDNNRGINPGMTEICDDLGMVDEDCDDNANDFDVNEMNAWGVDNDFDGYPVELDLGNGSWTVLPGCRSDVWLAQLMEQWFDPEGMGDDLDPNDLPLAQFTFDGDGKINNEDCDDGEPDIYPGGPEVCNDLDDDCDDEIDEGPPADAGDYWGDLDGDGYGAGPLGEYCAGDEPEGWVPNDDDCNDADRAIYPGADEIAGDGIDQNCDGFELCYHDLDGDGVGADEAFLSDDDDCTDPGESGMSNDCNDADPTRSPMIAEQCNGFDDDCDELVDDADSVPAPTRWYGDADRDGYGDVSETVDACTQPEGYVSDSTDCEDLVPGINPGAQEICDASNVDEDCDRTADDLDASATGKLPWYRDADDDGYGSAVLIRNSCEEPAALASGTNDDCDDAHAEINPGADEIVHDGIDQNCNGNNDDVCPYDELGIDFYPAPGFGSENVVVYVRHRTATPNDEEPYVIWTTGSPAGVMVTISADGTTELDVSECTVGVDYINVRFSVNGILHCATGGQVFANLNGVPLNVGTGVDEDGLCTEIIPLAAP